MFCLNIALFIGSFCTCWPQGAHTVLGDRMQSRTDHRGVGTSGAEGTRSCGGGPARAGPTGCLSGQCGGRLAHGSWELGGAAGAVAARAGARRAGVPLSALLRSLLWTLPAARSLPCLGLLFQDRRSIPQNFPQVNMFMFMYLCVYKHTHYI